MNSHKEISQLVGVGISASFRDISLCLWDKGELRLKENFSSLGMHTQLLFWIDDLLKNYDYTHKDIEFLVVDEGPGESFTGLRLSLALVKSWLMVCPYIHLYTCSSTEILYGELLQKNPSLKSSVVVVGFFGFQERAYIQTFQDGEAISLLSDTPLGDIPKYLLSYKNPILTGNFINNSHVASLPYEKVSLYTPQIAYAHFNKKIPGQDLTPNYFRKTQAEEQSLL